MFGELLFFLDFVRFLTGYRCGSIAVCTYRNGRDVEAGGYGDGWGVAGAGNEKYKGDALLQKTFTVDFLTKAVKTNEGEIPQ